MNDAFLKQAKARAAKYCSYRERAPQQVLEKLRSWKVGEQEAQQILTQLTGEKFVDETRFCRAFCHDKLEFNHWGKNRIRLELQKFGLSDSCVSAGLEEIDEEKYGGILTGIAQKKWASLASEPDPWKRKHKTAAFLQGKGFEGDLVWPIVNELSAS